MKILDDIKAVPVQTASAILADFIAQTKAALQGVPVEVSDQIEAIGVDALRRIGEQTDHLIDHIGADVPAIVGQSVGKALDELDGLTVTITVSRKRQ